MMTYELFYSGSRGYIRPSEPWVVIESGLLDVPEGDPNYSAYTFATESEAQEFLVLKTLET